MAILKKLKNVSIIDNPLAQDALSYLRDKSTSIKEFRYYSTRLCYELISKSLLREDVLETEIQTPLVRSIGRRIANSFVFVAILRSGVSMLNPALKLFPDAKVGFAGIYRDEKTARPKEYYWKMPSISSNDVIVVLDPMLATGGSMIHTLRVLKRMNPKELRVISIVASPKGLNSVQNEFPEVKIFLAALDKRLNNKKYIIPGLGDFGDRYFGTPQIKM